MSQEIKEKLAEIKELTTSNEERLQEMKSGLGDRIDEKLATTKSEMGEEYKKAIKEELNVEMQKYADLQKQVDIIQKGVADGAGQRTNFKSELSKFVHGEDFKSYLDSGRRNPVSMEVKASLVTGSNASGDTIAADPVGGVKFDPTRKVRMRDLIPNGSTSSNKIRHITELSYTDNAAMKAEASAFGNSEFRLDSVDTNVETLGAYIKMSNEMFDDLQFVTSYVSTRLPEKTLNTEDTQIVSGNGSSPNIQGLFASGGGTAYAAAADASADTGFRNFFLPSNYGVDVSGSVNEYDVLVSAIHQCTVSEYTPNLIILHPFNYHALLLRKSTQWDYVREGILPTVMGVPVVKTTAQTAGTFGVGDFNIGCSLAFRENMTVEFTNTDQDDFIKNMVTVRAKERLALPIYNANAFSWGTFGAAITALQ